MATHKRTTTGSTRRTPGNGKSEQHPPRVVLVLQGGGALGAYHVGAYQALQEAGYAPDWVSGISIGAINSAVIAGTAPHQRLERLEQMWHEISRPDMRGAMLHGPLLKLFNQSSVAEAMLFGQPNFWFPRFPNPLLLPQVQPETASFCDTTPMLGTLSRLVDFERINRGDVRLSLGATQVCTGTLVFFDNTRQRIGREHVLASGSLPPGFPPTRVEGELYWDGGCVSNTPLDAVYLDEGNDDLLVFMIDLWGAMGKPPTSMDAVGWRQKQIQYASRTAHSIRSLATEHNLRRTLAGIKGYVPSGAVDIQAVGEAPSAESGRNIHIVHVIYHPSDDQVSESDAEFSRPSIAKRRAAGYEDLRSAIEESPWTRHHPATEGGTLVHRLYRGQLHANVPVHQQSLRFMPAA